MLWLRSVSYPVLFVAAFLIAFPLAISATDRHALWTASSIGWSAAALLLLAGTAVVVACVIGFAREGNGTPAPFDPPRRLVQTGLYARVRNPIYWGALLMLIGEEIVIGSRALIVYIIGFAVVVHLFVVIIEEPTLTRLYGEEYAGYRARVRRWWPGLGRGRGAD